jgi:ATP-dependent DNA helicase
VVRAEREGQVVSSLHRILKPFVLRRMKEDVCLTLPNKREIVVFANMSEKQRMLTQHVLDNTLRQWMKDNCERRQGRGRMM